MAGFIGSPQFKRLIKQAKPIIDRSIKQKIKQSNQDKGTKPTNRRSSTKLIALAGAGILAVVGYALEQWNQRSSKPSSNRTFTPLITTAPANLPVILASSSIDQSTHPVLSTLPFTYGWPHLPYQSNKQSSDESINQAQLAFPVHVKGSYVTAWNPRLKIADWCIEVLTNQSNNQSGDRTKCDFHSEKSIDPLFRPSINQYSSPYDRGHMIPAGDTKLNQSNNQTNSDLAQSAMNDTFNLLNICPQHRTLNRRYWRSFEGWVRDLTRNNAKVTVITGPLILPQPSNNQSNNQTNVQYNNQITKSSVKQPAVVQYELLPPDEPMIVVPTHFYKILLIEPKEQSINDDLIVGAFILPNKPIPESINLSTFVAPINAIEQSIGYTFFPRLNDPIRSKFNKDSDICQRVNCDLTPLHKKYDALEQNQIKSNKNNQIIKLNNQSNNQSNNQVEVISVQ